MNFLAHLHLASVAQSSLIGNFVADFVRGNPFHYFSDAIAEGIMFHRKLDSWVDKLPEVGSARQLFKPNYYRLSAITLDLVWDHFLVKEWDKFEPTVPLSTFLVQVQQQIRPDLWKMPANFRRMNYSLWRENWLENYQEIAFVAEVLSRMESRHPKLKGLSDSIVCVELHYGTLQQLFWQFYPQLIHKSESKL